MKNNLFFKKNITNLCVRGEVIDANSSLSIFSSFFVREIYVSAAIAPRGKNGLERDITLQKTDVLSAITPVYGQNLGPESCHVWLLTQWIMCHCSSTWPCQSFKHSAVKSKDLIPAHNQEASIHAIHDYKYI